jgi:hypothetical protein
MFRISRFTTIPLAIIPIDRATRAARACNSITSAKSFASAAQTARTGSQVRVTLLQLFCNTKITKSEKNKYRNWNLILY